MYPCVSEQLHSRPCHSSPWQRQRSIKKRARYGAILASQLRGPAPRGARYHFSLLKRHIGTLATPILRSVAAGCYLYPRCQATWLRARWRITTTDARAFSTRYLRATDCGGTTKERVGEVALGRGHAAVPAGRPSGMKRTIEHGFAGVHHPNQRRRPAPHSLAYAVERNVNLGHRH